MCQLLPSFTYYCVGTAVEVEYEDVRQVFPLGMWVCLSACLSVPGCVSNTHIVASHDKHMQCLFNSANRRKRNNFLKVSLLCRLCRLCEIRIRDLDVLSLLLRVCTNSGVIWRHRREVEEGLWWWWWLRACVINGDKVQINQMPRYYDKCANLWFCEIHYTHSYLWRVSSHPLEHGYNN